MKHIVLIAGVGLLALAAAGPAVSADRPVYKAPIYVAPFSWSGFYVGLNGGYGFGTSNWTDTVIGMSTASFDMNGYVAGGTVGYNLQTGVWVWGLEGDLDYSTIKGSTLSFCPGGCETRNDWLGTVRGRIGYAWDRFLPFITGGAAFGDIKMNTPINTSQTTTNVGWTLGGGLEYAFMGSWSAKIEYLYVDLGNGKCDLACSGGNTLETPFKTNLVRAGVNYRF
jgi:outer membrane immunogenic protein